MRSSKEGTSFSLTEESAGAEAFEVEESPDWRGKGEPVIGLFGARLEKAAVVQQIKGKFLLALK
jgi:hypothetical protein